jgi:hypothetical protein
VGAYSRFLIEKSGMRARWETVLWIVLVLLLIVLPVTGSTSVCVVGKRELRVRDGLSDRSASIFVKLNYAMLNKSRELPLGSVL